MDPKERKALGNAFMRGLQATRDRGMGDLPAEERDATEDDPLAEGEDEASIWDADPTQIEAFPVQGQTAEADLDRDEPEEEDQEQGG